MARRVLAELGIHGVLTSSLRVVDHNVMPGVQTEMGEGGAWLGMRKQILAGDVLVFAVPIWMGHPSSIAQRVIERSTPSCPRRTSRSPIMRGNMAIVAVVDNRDALLRSRSSRGLTTWDSPFRTQGDLLGAKICTRRTAKISTKCRRRRQWPSVKRHSLLATGT